MNIQNPPIIAIVGEPNVGKSTLFNKIIGLRTAVTSTVAGTTRDRQYVDSSWNGIDFTLVDTAGITFGQTQNLETELSEQINYAVTEADLIIFVVDGKSLASAIDRKTILKFRKIKKPLILAVNKIDSPKLMREFSNEFSHLGIKHTYPISSLTGLGVGDLLDHVAIELKSLNRPAITKTIGIPVSIVGKPNVGKSSILNHILGQNRVVVSSLPGTTRTAIDVQIQFDGTDLTLIDTAGLKKKAYRQEQPDVFSTFQTFKSMRRSDVVFFVIDATETITKQDQAIAGEILDLSKGVVILANKMDIYEGDEKKLKDYISLHFPFLWFVPIFFISAKTGQGITDALATIKPIYEVRGKTIPQEQLDSLLQYTLMKNSPKRLRDQKIPKVYRLEQTGTYSPMFGLIVNHPAAISTQYRRYLEKQIINKLNFWGTPIKLQLIKKD